MYKINTDQATKIEALIFSELNMTENNIEELLRKNIDMICDEEESMLIVGKQVRNTQLGRSDLMAVDNNGDIVLIEIKRDKKDIEGRKEAFEFQAIRYAASYATIEGIEDLVNKVYGPYIERYRNEFKNESTSLTNIELGTRKLIDFLEKNDALTEFNEKQKVVLVASDFDEQTLSAVVWLNNNGVDMSCYKLIPFKVNGDLVINVQKLLPLDNYDDYYVDLIHSTKLSTKKSNITRRSLPRIKTMLEWGVVKGGDIIVAKDRTDEGTLMANGNILVDDKELTLAWWLKEVYGWSSVQTYVFAIHKESGKSLAQIREEYIDQKAEKTFQNKHSNYKNIVDG